MPHQDADTRSATRAQRLWRYLVTYRAPFIWGALFLLITQFLALRIPRELGRAVQLLKDADSGGLALSDAQSEIIGHAITIILLAVGSAIARILSRVSIFNAGRMIEYDMRNEVFSHLSKMHRAFYHGVPTGDLTSRVINDTTYVRLLYGMGVLHLTNTVFAYVIAMIFMAGLDWRLALLCLGPYPVLLFFVQRLAKALHRLTRIVQERLAALSAQAQEDLSGIAVIKTYAVEEVEAERFTVRCQDYVKNNLRLSMVRATLMPLMFSISAVGALLVLYFGGRAVLVTRTIDLGEFIEFSGYLGLLGWPTIALGWVISVWQRGTAAFDRLTQILDAEPAIVGPDPSETDTRVEEGRIEFVNVSFRYGDDGIEVLRDVDLTIESGSQVGIVGRSGSGKSSLINLIARMYDVSEGRILVDGVPIQEIPLQRLRSAIGYATQEPFLFSTTLEKNIRLGYDARRFLENGDGNGDGEAASGAGEETAAVDAEALQRAVEISQLVRDMGAFPDGLETMVGERGITLSGGQKQRVALARAIMTEPKILILDDSLSSVDTHTEKLILERLKRLLAGRTAIVVTHRFSILELMDEVIVLEGGTVAERGSHKQLMGAGGPYARMVERQKLKEEISAL